MAKTEEKIQARKMRRKGESINKIASALAVSKGTVSVWCRDIELTEKQKGVLAQETGAQIIARLQGARALKDRRQERIRGFQAAANQGIGSLDERDMLIALAALYWGEGNKTRRDFVLSNGDPEMIVTLLKWLRALGVERDRFAPRIFINEVHRSRIVAVQRFWEEKIGIPGEQFRKPIFIKTKLKKRYENHHEHYGTLRLRVLRSSDLFYRVMGVVHHLGGRSLVEKKT